MHPQLAAFVPAVAVLGRAVEAHLGALELVKTLLAAFAGSGASVLLCVTAAYALQTQSSAVDEAGGILYQPCLGFFPGVAALLMALRMTTPGTEVTLFSRLNVGVKALPGAFLVASALLGLASGRATQLVASALGALYCSWAYLRFFRAGSHGARGTPGDDVGFASLFPGPVTPVAERLAQAAAGVTGLAPTQPSPGALQGMGIGGALLPGTGAADAARRR